jgi:hypothetical protein
MKKLIVFAEAALIITFALAWLVVSVLFVSAAEPLCPAKTKAEIPKQYRGQWCYVDIHDDDKGYYRCKEANGEGAPYFGRNRATVGEADSKSDNIQIEKITRTKKGHRFHHNIDCEPERFDVWIDARGRLHIRGLDYTDK